MIKAAMLGVLAACGGTPESEACHQPIRVYFETCLGLCHAPTVPTIAVGGTWHIVPMCLPAEECDGMSCFLKRLDVPFTADDGGGPAVRVIDANLSEGVTVRAVQQGTNPIRIIDLDGSYPLHRPHIEDHQHRLDHANVGESACQCRDADRAPV